MPIKKYFNKTQNLTYHDLTKLVTPPPNLHLTLGLGHKFVVQKPLPNLNFTASMERLRRDIRLKYLFAGEEELDMSPFNRKNYIKSSWLPPPADPAIEEMMSDFQRLVEQEKRKTPRQKHSNMTKHQKDTIIYLKDHPDLIVVLSDKNLGPVIMERVEYERRVWKDHLNDKTTYMEITAEEAEELFDIGLKMKVKNFVHKYRNQLDDDEHTYFERYLDREKHRIPQFYMTIKVHKMDKEGNWKTRPVVGACGSVINGLSRWVDYYLSIAARTVPTYIKDSKEFQAELEKLGPIEPGSRLVVADAVSMYTNIRIEHCVETIEKYLTHFRHELPPNFPVKTIVEGLRIVMENAYFQFGEKYFKQKDGTSMGTSCACHVATLYFGWHERMKILIEFLIKLLFGRRFIDDAFNIEKLRAHKTPEEEATYRESWNFGDLRWTWETSTTRINYLDLTIIIDPITRRIYTKTYQKPMNLYLYIPENSAHPEGCTKGLIHGVLRNYYKQNSRIEDYKHVAALFHERLLARGYKRDTIDPMFMDAAAKFDQESRNKARGFATANILSRTKKRGNGHPLNNLFVHVEYHPRDISRKKYQELLAETCFRGPNGSICDIKNVDGATMKLNKPIIAYSKGKSIRDYVISSKFKSRTKILAERQERNETY